MNRSEILVSLEIGTSKVKVIIGEVSNDTMNIIGVGVAESKGMKKGAIVDIDQTVHSIQNAVDQAERMVDMEIRRVIVSINGSHIQLQDCHGVVAVSSDTREIANEDIQRVIEASQVMSIPPEREIVDVFPKQFIVDGQDEISDPRGMIGVRLEMQGTLITCGRTNLHNILKCVERAGLEVQDICLQSLAAGEVALSPDEKSLGVGLVNIGAGSTSISVFTGGDLVETSVIPLGGDNITKDLSIGMKTTTEEAEIIKQDYGHAYLNDALADNTFSVTTIGSNEKQTFNQVQITEIIEARLAEVYHFVLQEFKRMGYRDLPGGYVLTGGVMSLPGVADLARDIFQTNVRLSIPTHIGVREPHFTVGIGTLQFAYRNAKIQGKEYVSGVNDSSQTPVIEKSEKQVKKEAAKTRSKNKDNLVKRLQNYFFD
ncbi:cell division protein FtsA [Tenuibacillus multivorans]|uniref:Cell division protein FtsA n=1 Tax=Tenuibacillus multivorans TaxID=237069 RepID=A0A1G9Y622_9BACI|nr:cell division protein FtsA [Tenuibacillus multivorans]GEL75963.1 cell division protein FtsA [Tenuibacillus multivorans]SDN04544.1 cell division protein FtsA [Tenuibacillus multivorans]